MTSILISKRKFSLKKRILTLFFTLIFLAFLGFSTLSGRTIYQLVNNKIAANYKNNLNQTCTSVQNVIWNLNLVSQQLAYESEIQKQLSEYITSVNIREKNTIYHSLLEKIVYTTFSNVDIGLFYYYNPVTQEVFLNNIPLTQEVDLNKLPNILMVQNDITYYAPFTSQTRFNGNMVVAISRKIITLNGTELLLYVESGYSSIKQIVSFNKNMNSQLIFLDKDFNIVYSNVPENVSVDINDFKTSQLSGNNGKYYWFQQKTAQGWTVVSMIPSSVYEKETRFWKIQIILIAIISALIAAVFGLFLFKMIYNPLRIFDKQLDSLLAEDEVMELSSTNIPEYDYLLDKLADMKNQISTMIEQIIIQEKQYANIEIEKLRYQINPHFLMNTLNIIHWMAILNDQKDIDNITQSLNRLLAYNLDKTGISADLEQEISAASEYITLQKVRYDINYNVIKEPTDAIMDYPCPKFILQPLLENTIFHGYQEGMSITLKITVDEKIKIEIIDSGLGMSEEIVEKLKSIFLNQSSYMNELNTASPQRFGIGLQYVFQSIRDFYKDDFEFDITSTVMKETTITLTIPKLKGGGYVD